MRLAALAGIAVSGRLSEIRKTASRIECFMLTSQKGEATACGIIAREAMALVEQHMLPRAFVV
jgi:hypothetical protein